MKHIQSYYNKVDTLLKVRADKKVSSKKRGKGLLAPSMASPKETKKKTDIELIADFVQGIRDAKQEMMNG